MRFNSKIYTKLLWISTLVIASIIANACVSEPPKIPLRIVVANVKEQQPDESDADVAIRMEEHGRFIRRSGNAGLWSLVAANELPAQKLTGSIPGIGPDRWRAKKLDCPSDRTDEKLLSIYCLAWGLEPDLDLPPHQKGELGVVARDKYLEQLLINGEAYFAKLIGPERNGIQRRMLASRYTIMNSDKSVMFVSTHLSHTGASHDERTEELKDLIRNVKQIFVPGDLTPVLAGDFNCGTWTEQERKVIHEDFMIVSDGAWTEQVFVGRPQSFPGNGGVLWPEGVTHLIDPQDLQGNRLTDHRAHLFVELFYDPERQRDFIPPPVESVPGTGCIAPSCVAVASDASVWDSNSLTKFDFEGDVTIETPDHTLRWEDVNKYRPIIELKYPTCEDMALTVEIRENKAMERDEKLGAFTVYIPSNSVVPGVVEINGEKYGPFRTDPAVNGGEAPAGTPTYTEGFWIGCTKGKRTKANGQKGDDESADIYLLLRTSVFNLQDTLIMDTPAKEIRSTEHTVRCQ